MMTRVHKDWQPIQTMPFGRAVQVKSVKGVVCVAWAPNNGRGLIKANRYGPDRVRCYRVDGNKRGGDIVAIEWRELTSKQKDALPPGQRLLYAAHEVRDFIDRGS